MIRAVAASLLAAALFAPVPAFALETQVFVDTFAATCVPQRMSFEGTKAEALAQGWTVTTQAAHPELDAMMTTAVAMIEADEEFEMTFVFEIFTREVEGTPLHLVVSRSVAPLEDLTFTDIGCYLYDFAASEPPNPGPVGTLLDKPVARVHQDETITNYLWGPGCAMPRTGDTYMTYIPEGSPHAETTGFSGLMMKFATSEPDPGEVVPETYCTQGEAQ